MPLLVIPHSEPMEAFLCMSNPGSDGSEDVLKIAKMGI